MNLGINSTRLSLLVQFPLMLMVPVLKKAACLLQILHYNLLYYKKINIHFT